MPLGKTPSFEPDEQYKQLIESIFESKNEAKDDSKKPTRRRLKLPEAPKQTKEQEELSLQFVETEMEAIRTAFLEFTEKVGNSLIYGYLYGEVEKFVEACQDMESLLVGDVDESQLTEHSQQDYEKLKTLRSRILHDLYMNYQNKK